MNKMNDDFKNEDYEIAADMVKTTVFIYILVCLGFLIYFLFN